MKKYALSVNQEKKDEVIETLNTRYAVRNVHDSKKALNDDYFIHFECNKKTWKKIKKNLNLKVTSVYCEIKD